MSAAAAGLPLEALARVLEQACGLALAAGVRATLAEGFSRAARRSGAPAEHFLRRVLSGERQAVGLLVEHAVVGETYFFRHPEQLAALADLLDEAAPGGRALRLWSAGCATGEEPYSLAMLLLEAGRADRGDRILATDVSARALAGARDGVYGEWSLRRTAPALRARWFRPAGARLAVAPEVRARVELDRHNLVQEPPPGAGFDVVVCRNVLIYFSEPTAAAVLARLAEAVRPGGFLLLGPVEVALAAGLPLQRLERRGATLLRRPPYQASLASARLVESLRRRRKPPAAGAPAERAAPRCDAAAAAAFGVAREAARAGDLALAERLAGQAARDHRCPESFLLVALAAEARGDEAAALEALGRALELAPALAQAHAALVRLHARLGRPGEAAHARRAALEALEGLPDDAPLRGVEPLTAGALRQALGAPAPGALHAHGSER